MDMSHIRQLLSRRFSSRAVRRRVVVTGLGVVSPLGTGTERAWEALLQGACGVVALSGDEYAKLPCKVAALVPRQPDCPVTSALSKANLKAMAPATALALLATEEALRDARWAPSDDAERESTGVSLGVGMVDLEDVCRTYDALKTGYNKVSPFFVPRILPNMAAGQISIKHGFRGPNHAVSTACATGAHSIGDAFRFICNGDADVMVCGGAEACIGPLAVAGFCRMRALSTAFNNTPHEASRPFDQRRDGFVMGEGAAVLVLEEYEHAIRRGATARAEILGYGLSGDAAHATAPREDGSGAALSMRRALRDAGLSPHHVGHVNAHATSTPAGDGVECTAIRSVFGKQAGLVLVSSTKGAHGHLLGAAGNLEAVFTVLACERGVVPPILNLHQPIDDLNFVAHEPRSWSAERRVALKNSFGFGGTNATLCIGQV